MSADPGTTPFLLITIMATECVIGTFTQLNISKTLVYDFV